jgi:AraC-like DNA-binding protein
MFYQDFKPGSRLAPYVKSYFYFESASDESFSDVVFPSGCMEIIFNLGTGRWQTAVRDTYVTTPKIELWGQIVKPLPIKSIGKNVMFGVRFYPYAAGSFFRQNIEEFNNHVTDYSAIDIEATTLHQKLHTLQSVPERVVLLEDFLWSRLSITEKRKSKIALVYNIMEELKRDDFFDNIQNVAERYGITSRYLQKLFLQYTGLTPKLYSKINRFQNSLNLVIKTDTPLTTIAYNCGYSDQSHFIRDFKSFTGITPSGYTAETSPISAAFAGNSF